MTGLDFAVRAALVTQTLTAEILRRAFHHIEDYHCLMFCVLLSRCDASLCGLLCAFRRNCVQGREDRVDDVENTGSSTPDGLVGGYTWRVMTTSD